jgi:hypothetical protein
MTTSEEKYTIIQHILKYNGIIIGNTYEISGDYPGCVHIGYKYMNNIPKKAILSRLSYGVNEYMIKYAIQNVYNDISSIPIFELDDDSHICCSPVDMANPVPLAFFYIAYHGMTWYEAHFNAKMRDSERYTAYQKSLSFLTDPTQKLPFIQFIEIIGGFISSSSTEFITELETYYMPATTYREFFQNIPSIKRIYILYGWIDIFIEYYIGKIYTTKDWYINVMDMEAKSIMKEGSEIINHNIFSYKK